MQTIASLADRLDMSPEEALEKLRYMLFVVESIDAQISDEECDLLIDVDDDPKVADRMRAKRLKEQEKAQQRIDQLQQAARKAAVKRKAEAEALKKKEEAKAAAAQKRAAKRKKDAEADAAAEAGEEEAPEADAAAPAEAATDEAAGPGEVTAKKEALPEDHVRPRAEILPVEFGKETPSKADGASRGPAIKIGSAIEHDNRVVEIVRADGTHLDTPEIEIEDASAPVETEEEEELGVLAEAERRQEEEDRRKAKTAARPLPKPDPAVVAEVIRRAAERGRAGKPERVEERAKVVKPAKGKKEVVSEDRPGAQAGPRSSKTGKTARKRQKRAERQRISEESMRRDAAAAVREYQSGGMGLARKRKRKRVRDTDVAEGAEYQAPIVVEVEPEMTVERFAEAIEMPVNEVILELMELNILANKNQVLTMDVMQSLAEAQGIEIHAVIPEEAEVLAEEPDDPADLMPRAPVVTVMGHVDHGKTTLLDKVRSANVAAGEAGGITQHIAAYNVPIRGGRVVFLDTPGHEAFTQMRARGAHVTDIVVLVVAADDGVMPQTIEAIDHAKAAEVPIVVAINKCDRPDAKPERIRQELTNYGLLGEEWGGKTIMKNISALTGQGVDELMELLVLEAEMLELKANPRKRARGAIVESEIMRGLGPVAWVLVQSGTLKVGDVFLAGESYGRVRSMQDSRGRQIHEAGPATPVVVTGFDRPPDAGDVFVVVEDERTARSIAEKRAELARMKQTSPPRHITLEDFHERLLAGERKELNIVLKADVQGSVDVMETSLARAGNEEVHTKIVHAGVGGINESDILLASASDAVVIGFHVTANARVQKLAEQEGVEIRTFRVIYEAIDAVRNALEGMLAPEAKQAVVGHAEVREVFRSSAFGAIAGCYQQDGETPRNAQARLLRDGVVVYEGKIASLRRNKDDVRSVAAGFECGMKLENFEDVKVGDIIEAFRVDQIAQTLD